MPTPFKLNAHRSICALILFLSSLSLQAEVPTVTAPPTLELEFGKPFEYEIQASNQPIGYSVSGLPFWLKREGAFLRGTPVLKREQVITVRALNSDGLSEAKTLTLRVVDIKSSTQQAVQSSPNREN